jgi:hypothetical protein
MMRARRAAETMFSIVERASSRMTDEGLLLVPNDDSAQFMDQQWDDHVHRLFDDIRQARGTLRVVPVEAPAAAAAPHKGGQTAVILACAASATTAVAGVIKAWLRERERRSLTVTVSKAGTKRTIVINGSIADDTLLEGKHSRLVKVSAKS